MSGVRWLALVAVLACGGESSVDPLSLPVEEVGPFGVGYRTWAYEYEAPGGVGTRRVDLHLYYPTEDIEGEHPRYEGLFEDDEVLVDASLAPSIHEGGYPVHVHSHGHRGFGGSSAFLLRWLATHGWVSIAPDHTGNTFTDNVDPSPTSIYFLRATDVSASLDALEAEIPEADTERVLLSGHSRGVHTVWAVSGATYEGVRATCDAGETPSGECTEAEIAVFEGGLGDPRVVAAVPTAGSIPRGWFGETGHESVTIPMLLMTGGDDNPESAATTFATTTSVEMTWVEVAGGCHQLFALGGCEAIPNDEGFPLVSRYALAFGRRVLLGDESVAALLDGSEIPDPRVTLRTR